MDGLKIREDLFEPSLLETKNIYVKMHHSPINDHSSALKPASIKGNEHVLQELFRWLPLHSLPIPFERNKRPLLSVLSDSMTAEGIEAN